MESPCAKQVDGGQGVLSNGFLGGEWGMLGCPFRGHSGDFRGH